MSDLVLCFLFFVLSAVAAGQGQEMTSAALLITAAIYNLAYEVHRVADRKPA